MAELLALQPNIDIPLYVVVPDDRRDKALQQIDRPVFRQMTRPLPDSCAVLTESAIDELLDSGPYACCKEERRAGRLLVSMNDAFSTHLRYSVVASRWFRWPDTMATSRTSSEA